MLGDDNRAAQRLVKRVVAEVNALAGLLHDHRRDELSALLSDAKPAKLGASQSL